MPTPAQISEQVELELDVALSSASKILFLTENTRLVYDDFAPRLDANKRDPLAHLTELVDVQVLGTCDLCRGGSSPPVGIN